MGLFDTFPYTNFHELNLDWILRMLKEIDKTMSEFVAINALKYADPIQWDITSQYEKNTIVIDPQTGTAYISVAPVPVGVALSNTDYWAVVFDLGQFVVKAAKNFCSRYEEETTLTATFSSAVNDWIIWGDTLYRALVNITAGDSYVIDSNIKQFTVEDVTGHIQDLNTTDKSNLVAAINEVLQLLTDTAGDLDNLNTTDKSNLVAAINEVLSDVTNTASDLAQEIIDRTNADNTLEALIRNKIAIDVTNPPAGYTAMVPNDSSVDNAAALQALINNFEYIYMPKGTYYFTDHIHVYKGNFTLFGDYTDTILKVNDNAAENLMFVIIPDDAGRDLTDITFMNFCYDGNKVDRGLSQAFTNNSFITAFTHSGYNLERLTLSHLVMKNAPGLLVLIGGHDNGADMTQYFTRNILIDSCVWFDNDSYVGTSGAEHVIVRNCRAYHNNSENLCFDNNSLDCALYDSYIGANYLGIGGIGIGTCTNVVIDNCQFDGENSTINPVAKYRTGITLSNAANHSMNFSIRNCNFRNEDYAGIYTEYDPNNNTTISGIIENCIFRNCGHSFVNEVPYNKGIIKCSLLYGAYNVDNQQNGQIIFDVMHSIWGGKVSNITAFGADWVPTFTPYNNHRFGALNTYNVPKTLQSGFYHVHVSLNTVFTGSTPPDITDNKAFTLHLLLNSTEVGNDTHYAYLNGQYEIDTIVYAGTDEQFEIFLTDYDSANPTIAGDATIEYMGALDPYITDLLF